MDGEALIQDNISEEIILVASKIADAHGVDHVTVRKIISYMGVTNRVFYNRFHNIDEVLELIYWRAVERMRDSLQSEYDIHSDFFGYIMDVSVKVLVNTYEVKKNFSQVMFALDSQKDRNRAWWTERIKEIIEIGKQTHQLKDVNSDMLSYTIWCFFRGYNADAVYRQLSREEAVTKFKFGLQCLFDGIKA